MEPTDNDNFDLDSDFDFTYDDEECLPINSTTWLSKLEIYPSSLTEFKFFIKLLDVLHLFTNYNFADIFDYSPDRLDIFYLFLRYTNSIAVQFCEDVIQSYFIPKFEKIFYDVAKTDNKEIISILKEFYVDSSEFFIRLIIPSDGIIPEEFLIDDTVNSTDNIVENVSIRMKRFCNRVINSKYYGKILKKHKIKLEEKPFDKYLADFTQISSQILEYIMLNVKKLISDIYRLSLQITEKEIPDSILYELLCKMDNPQSIAERKCDAIDYFNNIYNYDDENLLININQYENFLYPPSEKIYKNEFWQCNMGNFSFYENSHSIYSDKAKEFGFDLYPDKPLYNILEVFVLHGYASDTKEIIEKISNTMVNYRNSPGIFNMYDAVDLETAYTLMAISNDINQSYEEFLSFLLQKHTLPIEYPTEFILRLISRILDTGIIFYHENMDPTTIDNTTHQQKKEPILIFAASQMQYYLLYPVGGQFIPHNIKKSNFTNTQDIVEV